jgi:UDP-N-acetylmuramate: L-alanyl-gamma-D-glutamyl-meso-diaminopimelate ligase
MYFSLDKACSLAELKPKARLHFIGVCGVAMAQLAVALSEAGFRVSGSDKEFYEPMAGILKKSAVKIYQGYSAQNISVEIDCVIIGNSVSYGHPEIVEVEKRQIPYTLFPKILHEFILSNRTSIVVSGTHGKSTTTSIAAFLFESLGMQPSYFIGAHSLDLDKSLKQGQGYLGVVEGDEYDSAFFAKLPKFHFYHPDILVVNAIEFDHADIYASLEEILKEFDKLIASMPSGSHVICGVDCPNVAKRTESWKQRTDLSFVTFGSSSKADYQIISISNDTSSQMVRISGPEESFLFKVNLIGDYNARNATAALLAARAAGCELRQLISEMPFFKGIRRRQEVRYSSPGLVVIEDFAHHPSAVAQTIEAVKKSYQGRRIIALFEPRSATSRKSFFFEDYLRVFSEVPAVFVKEVEPRPGEEGEGLFNSSLLCQKLQKICVKAFASPSAQELAKAVTEFRREGDVIIVMSNGSFDNIFEYLLPQEAPAS